MATCGRRSSTQRGKEGGKKILKIYGDVSVLDGRNGRQNAFRAHARLREEKKRDTNGERWRVHARGAAQRRSESRGEFGRMSCSARAIHPKGYCI